MAREGRNTGKSKGRSREGMSREETISRKLSKLLRHGAASEGLKLGRGGYANLSQVLQCQSIKAIRPPLTLQEISDVVATNSKQRFSLIHVSNAPAEDSSAANPDEAGEAASSSTATADLEQLLQSDADPANFLIRANQGHSIKLESGVEDLHTPITVEAGNLPSIVVHGTRKEAWPSIVASGGLKPMTRTHVHFATGIPANFKSKFAGTKATESRDKSSKKADVEEVAELPEKKDQPQVISGMRNSSSILMFLDLRKALDSGLLFYISQNGVVLSAGNKSGIIGLEFFERVEDRSGTALVENGKLVDAKAGQSGGPLSAAQAERKDGRKTDLPIREKVPMGATNPAGN